MSNKYHHQYFANHCWLNIVSLLLISSILFLPIKSFAGAIYDLGEVNFSTSNQSLWGTGNGLTPNSINYSYDFAHNLSLGTGIAGSANEVITPAWEETIPAVTVPVWSPSYFTCTDKWNGICYDGYWTDGHWYDKTITPSYTIGHDAITADTRIGTEVKVSTAGSFGIESDLGIEGGTVDAEVNYDLSLEVPDNVEVGEFFSLNPNSSVETSLTTNAPNLTGTLSTNLDASLSYDATECIIVGNCSSSSATVFDTGSIDSTVLQINTDDLPPDSATIFELDHQFGELATFDATKATIKADAYVVPEPMLVVSGIPLLDTRPKAGVGVNILELALDAPSRADYSGDDNGNISGSFDAEAIKMSLDLDALSGVPGGLALKAGPFEFRGDLVDVDLAPTVNYQQDIDFTPTLMVNLEFSEPVYIQEMQETGRQLSGCATGNTIQAGMCGKIITTYKPIQDCNNLLGQCFTRYVEIQRFIPNPSANIYQPIYSPVNVEVSSLTVPWNELPPIALTNNNPVTITPTFWLKNSFSNKTKFDFDLNVGLDLLKGALKFSFIELWNDCLDCKDFFVADLQNFDLFNDTFSLAGFNTVQRDAFTIGTTNQTVSYRATPPPSSVPEPATWLLILAALFVLIMRTNLKHQ